MAADLLARLDEYLLEVKVDGDRLTIQQVLPGDPPPAALLEDVHTHKAELLEWFAWQARAAAMWRAVFDRLRSRGDLPSDPRFQELGRAAETAHLRHDLPALADALLDLEAYANGKQVQS